MRDVSDGNLASLSNRSNNRAVIFAAVSAFASILMFAAGNGSAQELADERNPSAVNYPAFEMLTNEAADHRADRLISFDEFTKMSERKDTIILDTRSKSAFEQGHIKGSVHLNFSDFTDDKLAEVIPDFDTRILIYCNNNFSNNIAPVPVKRVSLALNIPTFINLYGYGYTNIYELGEEISIEELGPEWVMHTADKS